MKALKPLAAVALLVLLGAGLLLAYGIPAGWMTSAMQSQLARDTGLRVSVQGTTRIALWPAPRVTLQDVVLDRPDAGERSVRLNVVRIEAGVPFAALWSGTPQLTELTLTQPVLQVPLLRERRAAPAAPAPTPSNVFSMPSFERLRIVDGAVVLSNPQDKVERRIDGISADLAMAEDRRVTGTGSATFGAHPLGFEFTATAPATLGGRESVPVEFSLTAPTLLTSALTSKAELKLNGTVLMINGLSGSFGGGAFNGWGSADLAGKPQLKLDLDFQKLALPGTKADARPDAPWSETTFDLIGLNYVDAQARISAGEVLIGEAKIAPAAFGATLSRGVATARFLNLGAYGGQANGELTLDVTGATPTTTLRADVAGVRALPLLSTLAGFDRIDGTTQATLDLRSAGTSVATLIGALAGSAKVELRDGEIRGVNVARMIRALASGSLAGWRDNATESTDLSRFTASFTIDQGQAATSDLAMAGPLVRMTGGGRFDLPNQALAFRVDPKLVLTTQGQGGAGNPIGFGVPVVVEGPWMEPRIHLDVAGILDDPDGVYARLRQLGQGLFGPDGELSGLGGTLGDMIRQGLGNDGRPQPPDGAPDRPAPDRDPTVDTFMKQLFGR
uniref:AsmA family protein n=1 Tax=Rhodopseudomonas palustris (strain BisA53) TaxID=316055 RepID=Q07T74_RHOP5